MMSFLFSLIMSVPLCFMAGFWLNQIVWLFLSFMFLLYFAFNEGFTSISMDLGCDLLSSSLVMLSFWICSLMVMASGQVYLGGNWSRFFLAIVLSLMVSLYLTFSALNLFVFYVFFEVSLIPTLILIVGWGYQPERLQAGLYLLFYTMMASLPMMVSLFYCYEKFMSLHYYFFSGVDSFVVYLLLNFVFFIKIPMFFVHLWLPKAHVEAPVSGSMVLAGVMLKLGGYGMLRLMVMFAFFVNSVNLFFISLSLLGGVIVSLICLRQSDIKSLIAYSSVSHMGLVLSGIMTLNCWGMGGALVMMVAHGLCSSGLFCLANVCYERLLSRSIYVNKGLINIMPSLSLVWFMLISSSMAAPPSLNLLGEIMLINSLVGLSGSTMFFLMSISFLGAVYSLFLYSFTQHGAYYGGCFSYFPCSLREYLVLGLHWVPLNVVVLASGWIVLWF
uniref:NADH-ubiquinone oxidoreductase chain 4 n=1 Tax=Morphostenophanes yunnanus TaxID=2823840 RepID=A0A8F3CIC9_9CUCU|nr:NADH dehydrogenase subunit 4 [Morphostenophanes yunnanus]